jgi:hypothetical protein
MPELGDVVEVLIWFVVVGIVAIVVHYLLSAPAPQESLDCRDGRHATCLGCDGCTCHEEGPAMDHRGYQR